MVIALIFASADGEHSEELAVAGLMAYVFVPPTIHGTHGRAGAALGSLGLRVGAPILGAVVASASCDRDREPYGCLGAAAAGAVAGCALAVTLDATLLARERQPAPKRPRRAFRISPDLRATKDGASAGVLGVF